MNKLNELKKEYIIQYIKQCNDMELDQIFKKCVGVDDVAVTPVYPITPVQPYCNEPTTTIACSLLPELSIKNDF
jgi:hypothetical protein